MIIYILIGAILGVAIQLAWMMFFCCDGTMTIDISDPETVKAVKIEGMDLDELVDGHRKRFILKITRIKS